MDQPVANPGEINGDPIDRFTIGHAAFGYFLGNKGLSFEKTLLIAVGWEVAERVLKNQFPKVFPNPTQDTFANASLDVVAVIGGWKLGRKMSRP